MVGEDFIAEKLYIFKNQSLQITSHHLLLFCSSGKSSYKWINFSVYQLTLVFLRPHSPEGELGFSVQHVLGSSAVLGALGTQGWAGSCSGWEGRTAPRRKPRFTSVRQGAVRMGRAPCAEACGSGLCWGRSGSGGVSGCVKSQVSLHRRKGSPGRRVVQARAGSKMSNLGAFWVLFVEFVNLFFFFSFGGRTDKEMFLREQKYPKQMSLGTQRC